ncbi:Ribonuclease H2 subunit B [Pseudocercospora fuligena]|uniref:Ribonuclease H2 subunit B n=1 Tax=Pseudocercospora fuligena TaxID=685502 RepID=A0A8H6RJ89_9PEZI|nr:Ribonuclease H2 subunit B [Pseudocercospora fuligena]
MARTRTGKGATSKTEETTSSKPTLKKLEPSVETPPQVFILPKDASADARIVTIPNPATFAQRRYLVCPQKGIYEFTKISAPKKDQRSWLLAPHRTKSVPNEQANETSDDDGYVLQAPDMMVATPVDPLFLILPALIGDSKNTGQEFLASTDFIAKLTESSPHLAQVLDPSQLESMFASRIAAVSDCMDMGDEKMYALALPKLVKELVSKAKRMVTRGLPASMEDRFVKQVLDVPVLSIKREESSISIAEDQTPAADSQVLSAQESQESSGSATTVSSASTAATSISIMDEKEGPMPSPEITNLLRLRVALNFILSSYIVPKLRNKLEPLTVDLAVSGQDFSPLDKHLEKVTALKKEAQALRSLSDNISRKRANEDDDEVAAAKAEKKRKKEEEESKKKSMSLGLKKLAKADTSGMKKMSSFFTKAPAKK